MKNEIFIPRRGEILTSRISGKRYRVTRVMKDWVWLINADYGPYYPRGCSWKILKKRTRQFWRGEMPSEAKPLHPEL